MKYETLFSRRLKIFRGGILPGGEDASAGSERFLRLRVFTSEAARHGHGALYQAIVLMGREMNLAGATVLRSPLGFGTSGRLRTVRTFGLGAGLSIVIEIVDREERIRAFLPHLRAMMTKGLVTLEPVAVLGPAAELEAGEGGGDRDSPVAEPAR